MKGTAILVAFALLAALSPAHAKQTKAANAETKALWESCKTYVSTKDSKIAASELGAQDAAAIGFCKGYFRGFSSGISGAMSDADGSGHLRRIDLADGATTDQAIRVFTVLMNAKPELVSEDAGVVIMTALLGSDLAKLIDEGTYTKSHQ